MSSLFSESLPRSRRAAYQRQVWGEFFGDLIRSAREVRSLSAEEAARRAGMTASEWEAIEAGRVPRTREQLQAVAAGLDIEWIAMAGLAVICRQAWGR
jgi:transcriptional regulator with XRE-family HTH domain